MTKINNTRTISKVYAGKKTSDGDGVELTRYIGGHPVDMLDPFLLFDAFGSDRPLDYIGGFPPHPHRGFETVTYMLAGKMRHKDSAGNEGVIESGDIQWMTAGKGIIHSEMPEQEQGLLAGFQLWVNLPAAKKMTKPKYQEEMSNNIPVESLDNGGSIKVIAGKTSAGTCGVIDNLDIEPTYWHVTLKTGHTLNEKLAAEHNAFLYVISGNVSVGNTHLSKNDIGILTSGKQISIDANSDSQFLLIAGKPLNEPVARGGPFVMSTQEEVYQAFSDYQSGQF